jgi:hypothetical protein
MYARSAMYNPSLFREQGPLSRSEVAIAYIQLVSYYNAKVSPTDLSLW